MNRSLTATLALLATVLGASAARADLDSLLGDWAAAASHDTDSVSNPEVLLTPAGKDIAESGTNASGELTSTPKPSSNQAKRAVANKTLTSNQPHGISAGTPQSLLEGRADVPLHAPAHAISPIAEDDGVVSPTINPYCPAPTEARQCRCGSAVCSSSCGCGELLSQEAIHHLHGQSECRPHRSPVLPPPSNLLQMFRSKNSYSAVWAGYADETRARLRNTSPHLNGTWNACDDGGIIEPACSTCGPR